MGSPNFSHAYHILGESLWNVYMQKGLQYVLQRICKTLKKRTISEGFCHLHHNISGALKMYKKRKKKKIQNY